MTVRSNMKPLQRAGPLRAQPFEPVKGIAVVWHELDVAWGDSFPGKAHDLWSGIALLMDDSASENCTLVRVGTSCVQRVPMVHGTAVPLGRSLPIVSFCIMKITDGSKRAA